MSMGVNETHDVSLTVRGSSPAAQPSTPQTGQGRNTMPKSKASMWRDGHPQRPGSSWGAQMLFGAEEK